MTTPEKTTYISAAPGGHWHDWFSAKDRSIVDTFVVLKYDDWLTWYDAARGAQSAEEQKAARELLPSPVSRHTTYAEANAERDRRNSEPPVRELIITARIRVPVTELKEAGATTEDLLEGIQARLHPVVSCHPDEVHSSSVEVRLEAVT